MRFEEALKCMRERKEVKYRNDVYYIDKKGRLRVRYSDVEMNLIPSFTDEQIMSEEWEINMLKKTTNKKDIKYKIPKNFYKLFQKELSQDAKLIKELLTTDKLNKTEIFNISKGNVKEDDTFSNQKREENNTFDKTNVANNVAQRNSQDDELMKKIFPHKEIIEGESVLVFPYIEEAHPLKDVPQVVVSKMEKTTLTEQWKKGELEDGEYYIKSNKGDIYIDICANGCFMFTNYRSIEEVLEEVPDYAMWRNYVTGFCDEHEYNLKLLEENQNLRQFCEEFNALNVAEENHQLKELLKECKANFIHKKQLLEKLDNLEEPTKKLLTKIDEVLK